MSKKLEEKKNQHFIPQGYLRNFTIDGEKSLIWQYDKNIGKISKSPVSVRKICCNDYYYYQRDEKGEIDHISMEDRFSEVEGICLKVINSLKVEKTPSKIAIGEEEQGQLVFFLALILTRNPAFRDGINEMHGLLAQQTFKILYDSGQLPEMPEILKKLVEEKGLENAIIPEIFPEVSLRPMVQFAQTISLEMLTKIWTFYVPYNGKTFVMSDNPFSFGLAEGYSEVSVGPSHPYNEITIPLRKDLALIVRPSVGVTKENIEKYQCMCFQANMDQTLAINRRISVAALQYVYSSDHSTKIQELIKSLVVQKRLCKPQNPVKIKTDSEVFLWLKKRNQNYGNSLMHMGSKI